MAVQYLYLVDEFLRRKRLDPNEYYDVAIFGYLEAIQRECRYSDSYPEKEKNLPGLIITCIKHAVCQKWKNQCRDVRKANWLSISLDGAPACANDGNEISLYEAIADTRVNIEDSVIKRDLIQRILAEATPRERKAIDYACADFETHEIAVLMGVTVNTASRFLCNFRVKAHAVEEDREVIRSPQWARDKEKVQARNREYRQTHREELKVKAHAYRETHKEVLNAKKRAYWQEHKEELNAKKRAAYAARKAQSRRENEERPHTQPAVQSV